MSDQDTAAPALVAVAAALEAWYARAARSLPWREQTADPYAVWLSETMLQQTRVETVLGRYDRMLERFPDVEALAAADEAEVLAAWEGLGYYRRARQLHAAARRIVADHGGRLPDDPGRLAQLPGFGPYMTAAVASIAFGARLPATDANAVRVLARLAALEAPAGSSALLATTRALHQGLVDACRSPARLNQALMDLGAGPCGRRPRCDVCPLATHCAAFGRGGSALAATFPRRRPARPRPVRSVAMAVVEAEGAVLAARRPPGLLGGLWALPAAEAAGEDEAEAHLALTRALRAEWGAPAGRAPAPVEVGAFTWTFTHRLWRVRVYALHPPRRWRPPFGRWLDREERATLAFGGPDRRALGLAGAEAPAASTQPS